MDDDPSAHPPPPLDAPPPLDPVGLSIAIYGIQHTLRDILTEVRKTNGRVTVLEGMDHSRQIREAELRGVASGHDGVAITWRHISGSVVAIGVVIAIIEVTIRVWAL